MSRRPAIVTQADVRRLIRAVRQEGLHVRGVVVRADGIALETAESPAPELESRTVTFDLDHDDERPGVALC